MAFRSIGDVVVVVLLDATLKAMERAGRSHEGAHRLSGGEVEGVTYRVVGEEGRATCAGREELETASRVAWGKDWPPLTSGQPLAAGMNDVLSGGQLGSGAHCAPAPQTLPGCLPESVHLLAAPNFVGDGSDCDILGAEHVAHGRVVPLALVSAKEVLSDLRAPLTFGLTLSEDSAGDGVNEVPALRRPNRRMTRTEAIGSGENVLRNVTHRSPRPVPSRWKRQAGL